MSYIEFDKKQLINLEYSLNKELIRSNELGAYASTTIIYCNTRKYHGLLNCPVPELGGDIFVLLSTIDETLIKQGKEFHLSLRKYPGVFYPMGHKYIRDFTTNPIPTIFYRIGDIILKKESLLTSDENRVLLKYTLTSSNTKITLRLSPFLAFRNRHELSKANFYADKSYRKVDNGIKTKLYAGFPFLYMQLSKNNEYVHAPDWNYNIEYPEEMRRGYEYQEDLFVPGFFEIDLKKGESVIFSAGTSEITTVSLSKIFNAEKRKRVPRNSFDLCLQNAAKQFIVKNNDKTEIIAGFPWFGRWGRDTFISLPGLTLANGDTKTCKAVLDTMSAELKDGLFRNMGSNDTDMNSVDAPMWYFWAVQQYTYHTKKYKEVWSDYSEKMLDIINNFVEGTKFNIIMHDNGLIWAGTPGKALTWMDAVVNGVPVTPRIGYDVEINALWYNALSFFMELVRKVKQDEKKYDFIKKILNILPQSFVENFWDEEKHYLADYVDTEHKDFSVRPNQIFAISLPYSMLDNDKKISIIKVVKSELLTPRGLRTLSPRSAEYIGIYEGNQEQRDKAYHQGTVWPWLIGHYVEAILKVFGKEALQQADDIYYAFEPEMLNHGVCTVSEIFDADPPHKARGAISQAWSVAELLRIKYLINKFKK